jgi:predicted ribosomally synthesized peptide with SipW-like signal peptide
MAERINLTRRKTLAGFATIGAAGAGAGLGTSALFSDTESFQDNIVEAGRLNLRVSVDNVLHSSDIVRNNTRIYQTPEDGKDTADGNTITISVTDFKPGDWLILEWNAEVTYNPGYVQVTSVDDSFANLEGDNPEPETDTTDPGDLGDALLSTIWQSFPGSNNGRQSLGDLDPTTDLNDTELSSYEAPDLDGVTSPNEAHYTTINEAHDVYKTGVILRDPGTGDPLVVGSNNEGGGAFFYQLLELPLGVGNEIQGDEVIFTLRFDAEQVRNNPTPFSGT